MSYSLIGLHGTKADFKGTQSGLNEEKYQTILKEKHGHVRNDKKKTQQLDYPCLQEKAYCEWCSGMFHYRLPIGTIWMTEVRWYKIHLWFMEQGLPRCLLQKCYSSVLKCSELERWSSAPQNTQPDNLSG